MNEAVINYLWALVGVILTSVGLNAATALFSKKHTISFHLGKAASQCLWNIMLISIIYTIAIVAAKIGRVLNG